MVIIEFIDKREVFVADVVLNGSKNVTYIHHSHIIITTNN